MNIAVILAGGTGTRLGYDTPKQFVKIAGKMIIEHTIDVFDKHNWIDEIFIVGNANDINLYEEIVNNNQFKKTKKILKGGSTRSDSSLAAINAAPDDCNLIFHDAVRPLVNKRIINDCIIGLEKYNAVDVAIPSSDTVIQVSNGFIKKIPNRSKIFRGQTPQAFNINTIRNAYLEALKDPDFKATDDCGVVKKYLPEEPILIVSGENFNRKLTFEEDLFLIDKLFQIRSVEQSGIEQFDFENLKDKTVVVFGGTYGIGEEIVKICRFNEAKVFSFSRSQNNVDVSDSNSVKQSLKATHKETGKIDYVVNTAGVLHREPLINMDYETINMGINVNYLGSVIVAKESFKYLSESNGSLLFFTSSSYTRGRAMYSIYSSLKAAVVNLVQALSSEWENYHIRINCINPQRTKTPMRVRNFGVEDPSTLLDPNVVANMSVGVMLSELNGQVIDVKQ